MFDPASVLAFATVGLVVATIALVYATWNLYSATRSMDRREALEERRALLLRKIDLAMRVAAVTHGEFHDRLRGGSVPVSFLDILALAGILEYQKDTAVSEMDMRRVVMVLREANRGTLYREGQAEEEWVVLHRVQEQLAGSLFGWYDDLGRIAAQLSSSLDSQMRRERPPSPQ